VAQSICSHQKDYLPIATAPSGMLYTIGESGHGINRPHSFSVVARWKLISRANTQLGTPIFGIRTATTRRHSIAIDSGAVAITEAATRRKSIISNTCSPEDRLARGPLVERQHALWTTAREIDRP